MWELGIGGGKLTGLFFGLDLLLAVAEEEELEAIGDSVNFVHDPNGRSKERIQDNVLIARNRRVGPRSWHRGFVAVKRAFEIVV